MASWSRVLLSFCLFAAIFVLCVQVTTPSEYYKCTDANGKVVFSNIACPSKSQKNESYKMKEMTEREYQESQRKQEDINKAIQQTEAQLEKVREKERRLNQCLAYADQNYKERWDSTCQASGHTKGCYLSSSVGSSYDQGLRGQRQECYLRHQ
jgi:hypothetical protein